MKMLKVNPQGKAKYRYNDYLASLDSTSDNYVGGKAMNVHMNFDDLGEGGDEGSIAGGNAGARVACCNIELVDFATWSAVDINSLIP